MDFECRVDALPGCYDRWIGTGVERQATDGHLGPNHGELAQDGGYHLFADSLGECDELFGYDTSIASGLVAVTGDFYPLVAPMIGAIGTFVTGSDTSSNILFAKLQAHVANQLGMTGTDTFFGVEGSQSNWLVAANTTGATGGKMISPQSIAIATASCDMEGKDGEILRSAIPYAVLYIVLGGLMVYLGC